MQQRDGSPPWDGNITWGGIFGRLRPDLIYNDGNLPPNLFELKPVGSEAAGALQLQTYLSMAAAKGAVAGDMTLIFQHSETIVIPGAWFSATTYTFKRTNVPGVVTYTIDNPSLLEQFERAIQKNNGKVPGLPWWPRRLILP